MNSVTDALGNRSALAYRTSSAGGASVSVTDPVGGISTYVTESHGLLTSFTDAVQNTQSPAKPWLYAYTFTAADPTKLQTESITNPRGLVTQLTYDSLGNVLQSQDLGTDLTAPGVYSRTTSMAYLTGSSDLAQTTDAENNTTTNTWSSTAPIRLQSVTDPLSHSSQYTYSTSSSQPGYITAVTDANLNQTQYSYDAQGNVTSVGGSVNVGGTLKTLVRTMTYYADGSVKDASELHNQTATTYPITHTDYDNLGRRIRVEHPDGSLEAWLYDPSGNVALQVDSGGLKTAFDYDAAGRLTTTTDNAGNATSFSYDAAGNRTAVTDANGHTTSFQYDRLHRLTQQQQAAVGQAILTTSNTYDEMGNVTAVTTGDKQTIGSAGYTITNSYYLSGLLSQTKEPLLSDGVLLSNDTTAGTGQTVSNVHAYQYNRVGKPLQVTDGNGNTTAYLYDAAYRLSKVTDAAGGVTEYAYDAVGNRTDVWDAQHTRSSGAISTHFAFDALNRLLSTTDPLSTVTSQTYDDSGNLAQRTEQRSSGAATTTYGYDLGHRVTSITYPASFSASGGTGPFSATLFAYDGGGRRLFRRDDWGMARYSYDSLGRLARGVSLEENSSFGYDAVGNRTSAGFSLGTINYAYDADNRMVSVNDPYSNQATYSYDGYGHVSQITLPGGVTRSYAYDALPGTGAVTNRLHSLSNTAGTTTFWTGTYQYDYTGNVRHIGVTSLAAGATTPASTDTRAYYDGLNRLLKYTDTALAASSPEQTTLYAYDRAGNRTGMGNTTGSGGQIGWGDPNTVVQNTYDAANRAQRQYVYRPDLTAQLLTPACTASSGPPDTNVGLEPNGNVTSQSYWVAGGACSGQAALLVQNGYDATNHLVSHSETWQNSLYTNEQYAYDADGRRVSWTNAYLSASSQTRSYEYVGGTLVGERDQGYDPVLWYVPGQGGEALYTVHFRGTNPLSAEALVKDHLGSVRGLVGSGSSVANSYTYNSFGRPASFSKSLDNSLQFTGAPAYAAYSSSTAGFASAYHLGARTYDMYTGRFLTQDTYRGSAWAPWTQNLYVYVGNNPVNYTDPTGHDPEFVNDCNSGDQSACYWRTQVGGDNDPMPVISRRLSGPWTGDPPVGGTVFTPLGLAFDWAGALSEASQAAFKAAETAEDFSVSAKHLANAGGNWAKFLTDSASDVSGWIKEALSSPDAQFLPNNRPDSFRILVDMGRAIGTKGEQIIQIIVGADGKIWTAYPVK